MSKKQKRVLARILLSGALLLLLTFLPTEATPLLRFALFMVPYLLIGYDILIKAFRGIFRGQLFDESFLMAVATIGAIVLAVKDNGSYTEAIAVMLFYQTGELFERLAVGKSRKSIGALMDIRPDTARLETPEGTVTVDPEEVPVGSIIVVSPGERIPLDGTVVDGNASLNTAALTGESMPREVAPDDTVYSGSVCLDGVIRIRTEKAFGDSTVARILELVENSAMKKAKSEKFITRFARIYTPAVCGAALLLALLPPAVLLLAGKEPSFGSWVYRALTFLVISCPCALVISIPLTFFAGIGGASRQGILVKGADALEALSETGIMVFDKTGTLTKGVFEVRELRCEDGVSEEELLRVCALAESFSSHPIGRSLCAAYGKPVDTEAVTEVREFSGRGVTALTGGRRIAVGNKKLMEQLGIDCAPADAFGTAVYAAVDGAVIGCAVIADAEKPTAAEAIRALRQSGVGKTVMLTGDSRTAAQHIADALGIDEVHAQLLPEEKVQLAQTLGAQKKPKEKLAFAGDGINDAPVLACADIGIAMGALGSDAAIEAADVVLMDDDPLKIAAAMRLSRRCLRIVKENIWLALGIKLLCLVLGALGIANMWLAVFADVGVMVLAVLNAVRALK